MKLIHLSDHGHNDYLVYQSVAVMVLLMQMLAMTVALDAKYADAKQDYDK